MTPEQEAVWILHNQGLSGPEICKELNIGKSAVKNRLSRARRALKKAEVEGYGYNLTDKEKTPEEAWNGHVNAFERAVGLSMAKQWKTIRRDGPFVIFHCTDEHIDDDKSALNILKADIDASHDMDAIMVHGGDLLNNWPVAGRLAKEWAQQQCTLPDGLLRAQHFIEIFKPDVWVDGNHEEMNPYLMQLFEQWLPKTTLRDYWTCKFQVKTPNRTARCAVSHKFSKGSSWFHKLHGHLREILEGEEADLLMDGHLHSDGVIDQTLPERDLSTLCVASAGYKLTDKYAARISRGGKIPKMRGRAHWIVFDDQASESASPFTAFKEPSQAEAYLSGLMNLREV